MRRTSRSCSVGRSRTPAARRPEAHRRGAIHRAPRRRRRGDRCASANARSSYPASGNRSARGRGRHVDRESRTHPRRRRDGAALIVAPRRINNLLAENVVESVGAAPAARVARRAASVSAPTVSPDAVRPAPGRSRRRRPLLAADRPSAAIATPASNARRDLQRSPHPHGPRHQLLARVALARPLAGASSSTRGARSPPSVTVVKVTHNSYLPFPPSRTRPRFLLCGSTFLYDLVERHGSRGSAGIRCARNTDAATVALFVHSSSGVSVSGGCPSAAAPRRGSTCRGRN